MFAEDEPEPESLPPQPAVDISKATNDDFVEVDNSENDSDYGVDGILPNHGQIQPQPAGAAPPMAHPGVPGMYPAMHPGMYPGYPYPQPGYPYAPMPHVPYVPPG